MEAGDAPEIGVLKGCPGLAAALCTLPTSPLRGLWAGGAPLSNAGRLFAVAGSKLYEVNSLGQIVNPDGSVTTSNRGDVGNDGYPAQIFPNGDQLLIVSNGTVYVDNGGAASGSNAAAVGFTVTWNGFVNTSVSTTPPVYYCNWVSGDQFDPSLVGQNITINSVSYLVARWFSPTALHLHTSAGTQTNKAYSAGPYTQPLLAHTGAFLDSFFIVAQANSKQLNVSAPNDGTSWDPTDTASKESYPDNIGALLADHQELIVFGESHSEVWQAPGADPNFPFQPNEGYAMNLGIAAPWSACSLRDGAAWIASSARGLPIAYYAPGFVPRRISTHAIEQAWAGYASLYAAAGIPLLFDAQAFTFEMDGHEFWRVSFPLADATWEYDATASQQFGKPMWHECSSDFGDGHLRHRASCHAYAFNKHWAGDYANGNIYELSASVYQDAGHTIKCVRTLPHMNAQRLRQFFQKFQLDLETGGANALTVILSWSDDGGSTWSGGTSDWTITASTTKKLDRITFFQLGSADDRVWRVQVSGNARVALVAAYNDILTGIS